MKTRRHQAIVQLVRAQTIADAPELARRLAAQGFEVHPGMLERDLRLLGVVAEHTADGGTRLRQSVDPADLATALDNLRQFLVEITPSHNLLVVRTRIGGAQPVAVALEHLQVPGLLGSVAGDDTVLSAVAETTSARAVMDEIWAMVATSG